MDENRPQLSGLEGRIAGIVMAPLEAQGYELVRVQVTGGRVPTVQVMADRADGASFTIEDCEAVSRLLSAVLDVDDPMEGAWNLEVSSPGIDRPLTRVKDWNRFAGHLAKVELAFPDASGRPRFTGTVMGADDQMATLKLEDGAVATFPLADIRRGKLVLTEALIQFTTQPAAAN